MVVGIMVGSGIFRTPGVIAAQLGRPWLTFVAWVLGGVVALLGALIFAELGTRHPQAGGKYVYAREAFGPRAGFVIGVVEVGIYATAIAGLGVVVGEYAGQLAGWPASMNSVVGALAVAAFTAINIAGVAHGRWVQNVSTAAKILALAGVTAIAFVSGTGAGWSGSLPNAPEGGAAIAALAVSFQAVIWTYYGYPDAAKIAEEVVEPTRTLPRIYLASIALTVALYLLVNAAFLHVVPFETIASSKLVAGDVAIAIFGPRGGMIVAALALLVVLASINGNVFVTPRVVFAIARDGLAPGVLARINRGDSPWVALLVVGGVAVALAITGTFEQLLRVAITLVLVIDGATAVALVVLRRREPAAPFMVPAFPLVAGGFIAIYGALLVVGVVADPAFAIYAGAVVVGAALVAVTRRGPGR
jgi:amino acid transporter